MKILICGGRDFNDYNALEKCIDELLPEDDRDVEIVSGHAAGADTLGERYAVAHGLVLTVFPADWKEYGRKAGILRNAAMIDYISDDAEPVVVACWNGQSRGTKDTVERARARGYRLIIISY